MRPTTALAGLLALAPMPACAGGTPTLEDSTGVRVQWTCEAHDCQVTGSSIAPPDCDGDDIWVVGAGALGVLCSASIGSDHMLTLREATCRPLICASESDCPEWPDRHYGCDSGFCTTADLALDALDIEATCLRTLNRADTCAEIDADPVVASAMSTATTVCMTGCAIPASCRP